MGTFNVGLRVTDNDGLGDTDRVIITVLKPELPDDEDDGEEPIPSLSPTSIQDELDKLPPSERWAVSRLVYSDEGAYVASLLEEGTAIAVIDGSGQGDVITSAFIITHRSSKEARNKPIIRGDNRVPAGPDEADSYRAELGGILGVLIVLQMICHI